MHQTLAYNTQNLLHEHDKAQIMHDSMAKAGAHQQNDDLAEFLKHFIDLILDSVLSERRACLIITGDRGMVMAWESRHAACLLLMNSICIAKTLLVIKEAIQVT